MTSMVNNGFSQPFRNDLARRPGCSSYFDSYKGVGFSSGMVASWTSQAPSSVVFSVATGSNQPGWSSVSFLGKPGITFDGIDDRLNGPLSNTLVIPTAHTMFCVFIPITDPGSTKGIFSNASRSIGFNARTSPMRLSIYAFDSASKIIDFPIVAGKPYVTTSRHDGTNFMCSMNGAQEQSIACGSITDLAQTHRIGMGPTSGNSVIAMCATFNRCMAKEELYYCISREKIKWGIT